MVQLNNLEEEASRPGRQGWIQDALSAEQHTDNLSTVCVPGQHIPYIIRDTVPEPELNSLDLKQLQPAYVEARRCETQLTMLKLLLTEPAKKTTAGAGC